MDTLLRTPMLRNGSAAETCAPPLTRTRTSFDRNGTVVENLAQPMREEVAQALSQRRQAQLGMLAISQEADFTQEMRREHAELRRRASRPFDAPGVDHTELD